MARPTHLAVQKLKAIHDVALCWVAWKYTESGTSRKVMMCFSRTPTTKWTPEELFLPTASSPKGTSTQSPQPACYVALKCSIQTFPQWNIISNPLLPQTSLIKSKINDFLLGQNRDEKYEFDKILKNIHIITRILPFFTVFVLQTIFEKKGNPDLLEPENIVWLLSRPNKVNLLEYKLYLWVATN